MNPPDQQQTDLNHLLRILWRRRRVVLVAVLLLPAVTYAVSSSIEKTYEATVTVQVQPNAVDTSLFEGGATVQAGAVGAAARLIETTAVAKAAARRLDPAPRNPRELLGGLTATPDEEAGFIQITATDSRPQRAADIANAFAAATVAIRSNIAREHVGRAIAALTKELAGERRGGKTSREQLSQELQRLRALRSAQGENANVVEPAASPGAPVSPKPLRNATLALVLALMIGVALALLLERLDRRMRSPHELEEFTGLPLLSAVPASAFPDNESSGADSEAFQTLRASLTYFNVDRPLKKIIVSSPLKGDGKTTVATNLAISIAKGGKKVILVDADLRRPQVATRLGLVPEAGLADVLAGEASVEDALIDVHVAEEGRLRVLPAGPPPPNPSELLGSERVRTVLGELEEHADVVVVDSTPILPVSDILPLIREASGIVAVCRMNRTTRDSMRRFLEVVTMAGGSVLGFVATDTRAAGLYDGYGYGYGSGRYERDRADSRSDNGTPESAADRSVLR